MRSGLRPIHSVETITWTSEMSGTASSGVRVIAQTPQSVSTIVPMETRKRLAAHQSMTFSIMVRFSRGRARHRATTASCLLPRRWPPRVTVTVVSPRPGRSGLTAKRDVETLARACIGRGRRSIESPQRRAKLALRVEEERGAGRDLLSGLETLENVNVRRHALAGFDASRLEVPVALRDEHNLLGSRVKNGVGGHDNARARRGGDLDIRVHAGLEPAVAVHEREADLVGARLFVHVGVDIEDLAGEALARVGIERHGGVAADLDERQLGFIHVRLDPHDREVRSCTSAVRPSPATP